MDKQSFNLHTHTWRCGHAVGTDDDYVKSAISAGFTVIGFSEHIQYRADKGKYNRINFEDFEQYFADIRKVQHAYRGKITILCGLECAYVPEAMDDVRELKDNCDYILLGQHQGGLSDKKYCLKCDDTDVLQYARDIENAIETGLYSVIAHPDFFMTARDSWSRQCTEASENICRAAKVHHIPLELNIKGSHSKKVWVGGESCVRYPYRKFWEIAAKVGNEVLYGWDAHKPEDLEKTPDVVNQIIQGLQFKWVDEDRLNTLIAGYRECRRFHIRDNS